MAVENLPIFANEKAIQHFDLEKMDMHFQKCNYC